MDLMNLSSLNSQSPSIVKVLDLRPLSPSIFKLSLEISPFLNTSPNFGGKYLKLVTPIGVRNYSIEGIAINNDVAVINLIIGGSSLFSADIDFLDYCKYCLIKNSGVLCSTQVSIEGRCYLRKTLKHDKLFIAAGTGFSFIKPILVDLINFYQEFDKFEEGIKDRSVEAIWANKSIYNIYLQSNLEDLVKEDLPTLNFSYKLLVENQFSYQEEYLQKILDNRVSLEKANLIDYLKNTFIPEKLKKQSDLSNTIIYIGGSKLVYESVKELLINSLKADPNLIVCDHHTKVQY